MSEFRRKLLMSQKEEDKGFFIALGRNSKSNNNVCWSFDSGNSWEYRNFNCSNCTPQISQDLTCFIVTGYGGRTWFSLDRGGTWHDSIIQLDYADISANGNVITGCQSYSRKTYRLTYPFTSYTQLYTATQDIWTSPTINYDGSLIIGRTDSNRSVWTYDNGVVKKTVSFNLAMNQPFIASTSNIIYTKTNNGIYKSLDRGETFNLIRTRLDTSLEFNGYNLISNNGEFFILSAQNSGKVCVFYDYGANNNSIISNNSGRIVASCSSSGKYMAYTAGLNVYVSSDYGQTFRQIPTPPGLTTGGNITTITIEDIY